MVQVEQGVDLVILKTHGDHLSLDHVSADFRISSHQRTIRSHPVDSAGSLALRIWILKQLLSNLELQVIFISKRVLVILNLLQFRSLGRS